MDSSVKVPSAVKSAIQPATSLSSAIWYALRMIFSFSYISSSPSRSGETVLRDPGRLVGAGVGQDGGEVLGGPFLGDLAVGQPVDVGRVPAHRSPAGRD